MVGILLNSWFRQENSNESEVCLRDSTTRARLLNLLQATSATALISAYVGQTPEELQSHRTVHVCAAIAYRSCPTKRHQRRTRQLAAESAMT
jgi:hypothetical protein